MRLFLNASILSVIFLISCSSTDKTPDDYPVAPGISTQKPSKYVHLDEAVTSTPVSVAFTYSFKDVSELKSPYFGLCWNTDGAPTISDAAQAGCSPLIASKGRIVISNALLDYGKEYFFRPYITDSGKVYYGNEVKAALGKEPQPIVLNWTELESSELPSSVSVYFTEDKLNGDPFNAWYAVADLSKKEVEVKVKVPSTAKTIDDQAKADPACCVLVNGSFFYYGNGYANLGISVVNGVASGSISSYRGSLSEGHPEYNNMYFATRGIFGVDQAGIPAVYWAGGTSAPYCYYDRPLPSVVGDSHYRQNSSTFPAAPVSWTPKYALSAGPVLLYDGKTPVDFTLSGNGNECFLNNFEIIPYDIFNVDSTPDRTAVGFTDDGKVIFFVCDGRYSKSGGATLTELAMIMKGLGCVGALNLDGGGSTGMMVGGVHVNDVTTGGNREVMATVGFFRK